MKNSTKKHLLLLVAIIALMSAVLFAMPMTSAASCECETPVLVDGETIQPTCTEQGYTEVKCSVCNTVVGKKDVKDAVGHSYGDWTFETSGDNSEYNKLRKCERCSTVHYEYEGDARAVYYIVTYVNPWDTATQDDLGYTKLAKTYQDEYLTFEDSEDMDNVYQGKLYVLKGATAEYLGKTPYREKDKAYGKYDFIGWTYDAEGKNAYDVKNAITANTTLYAQFAGDSEVFYYVTFFKENGAAISKELTVRHGNGIDDTNIIPLTAKEETVSTVYTFDGWDIDISAIYASTGVMATYTDVPQKYDIKFYKYDGTPYKTEDGTTDIVSTCDYGKSSLVTEGFIVNPELLERDKDLRYIYSWTGEWALKNRPTFIAIDKEGKLTLPDGTDPDVEYVEVTPVYNKRIRVYELNITLVFPDEVAENAVAFYGDNTTVQVTADGQYYGGYGSIVKDPVTGLSSIQYSCNVSYSSSYQIVATTYDDKYIGQATSIFLNESGPTQVIVNMAKNETGERCGCICHNAIFRGLWARILNLIYNIFGRKIVCCDDMYATLGDLLAYTINQ